MCEEVDAVSSQEAHRCREISTPNARPPGPGLKVGPTRLGMPSGDTALSLPADNPIFAGRSLIQSVDQPWSIGKKVDAYLMLAEQVTALAQECQAKRANYLRLARKYRRKARQLIGGSGKEK